MASFDEIRQEINDNIYENQDGDITGEVLNEVLNDMVDAMEDGNLLRAFKGWWPDLATLKAAVTAEPGDYAYIEDASPATTTSIYVYDANAESDNYWADSGRDVDTSNVQTFQTGEEVNLTPIDDTHLDHPNGNSLAKAEDASKLKYILEGFYSEIINVDTPSEFFHNDYYVHGTTGALVQNTGQSVYFEKEIPAGAEIVKFLGWSYRSTSYYGYALGHYENGSWVKDYAEGFTGRTISSTPYEYVVDLREKPSTVTHLRSTVKFNYATPSPQIINDFYCCFIKADTVMESIGRLEEALTYDEETVETPYEAPTSGYFINGSVGSEAEDSLTSNSNMQIVKYEVEEGTSYKVNCFNGEGYSFYCVFLIDSNGYIIGRQFIKSLSAGAKTWTNETIQMAEGTAEIWMNVQISESSKYALKSVSRTSVDIGSLKSRVEINTSDIAAMKSASAMGTKLMKVTVDTNQNILVRTALTSSKDIAVKLYHDMKEGRVNNITFDKVYVGDKGMSDDTIMQYEINSFTDSTPPVATTNFGYLYANHGWAIPAFTILSGSVTDADINSEWIDAEHDNRSYYIGKISGSVAYLIPKITGSDGNQAPSLNWWNSVNVKPVTLTNASNSSRQIIGTSSRYDLTVQIIKATHYIADGVEMFVDAATSKSTFYCNTFCICQDIECKAPWSITTPSDWFENSIPFPSNSNVFIMQRSYNFASSACTVNVSMNCESSIKVDNYFSVQPQQPFQVGSYNSTTYFPKASQSGHLDMGVDSNSTNTSAITIYRNNTNLHNVDDQTDRVVTVLKNASSEYLLGVASGMSLDKGMTTPSIRNTQTVEGSSGQAPNSYVLVWNVSGARNKCYFRPFKALGSGTGWSSGMVNTDFVKDFVTYFAWFDPNANPGQQVYWVKEGDYWLVYAHAQTLTGKVAVNLPAQFEGMSVVDTLEHTTGATLLTDVVTNGRLYVKYATNSNGQANFITLKLK